MGCIQDQNGAVSVPMRTKQDQNGDNSGPRRYQIKAHVSLITHEKFRVYSQAQKRSMQRAAEALIEETVRNIELPPFPEPRKADSGTVVAQTPVKTVATVMTSEQKKAYEENRAKLRAEFNPEERYLHWRRRGCTRERATQMVDDACRNWEMTWAGVTEELEARVRPPKPQAQAGDIAQENGDDRPDK